MKNSPGLSDRLVKAAGTHLDRVFNAVKINAGNSARLQYHISQLSYSFFIRYRRGLFKAMFSDSPADF
jgi:hypothetical protein